MGGMAVLASNKLSYWRPRQRYIGIIKPQDCAAMSSSQPATRWAAFARDTNETKIQLALNLDGGDFPPDTDPRLRAGGTDGHASQLSKSQTISINTGIGFLDHMLHALAKHAGWSLALACKGDLYSARRP
jgi:imidazoleglycerol-phosphate dehydratase